MANNLLRKTYRYGNWNISNLGTPSDPTIGGFSPELGEQPTGVITISSPDQAPAYYLLNNINWNYDTEGQTVEVVVNCKKATQDKPFILMAVLPKSGEAGSIMETLYIYPTKVVYYTANNQEFNVEAGTHRYTLSIEANKTVFYIDKNIVYINTNRQTANGRGIFAGYLTENQAGEGEVDIYYLKTVAGAKKYIQVENTDFVLEIDSSKDFDSINKHTYTKASFHNQGNLFIGAKVVNNTATDNFIGNVKAIAVTNNNVLAANLIPCKQVVSNKFGFYDRITETFLTPVAGTFTAGPATEVDLPAGYTGVEYISFTGTQYLDLDILSNQHTTVNITFNTANTDTQYLYYAEDDNNNNVISCYFEDNSVIYQRGPASAVCTDNIFNEDVVLSTRADALSLNDNVYNIKLKAWDPIAYMCGNWDATISDYDNKGIVSGCSIKLPQRQPGQYIKFYYRVKTIVNYAIDGVPVQQESAWAYSRKEFTEYQVDDSAFSPDTTMFVLPDTDNEAYDCNFTVPAKVLLPVPDRKNWTVNISNAGNEEITVVFNRTIIDLTTKEPRTVEETIQVLQPKEGYKFVYDGLMWDSLYETSQQLFYLNTDNSREIFSMIFNNRLPSGEAVYSKGGESGVVATLLKAYSHETDRQILNQTRASDIINILLDSPDDLFARYGNVFNLDKSLFKNQYELRDMFQQLVKNEYLQTKKAGIYNILFALTGTKPVIHELHDKNFWVIYNTTDAVNLSNALLVSDDDVVLSDNLSLLFYMDGAPQLNYTDLDAYAPAPEEQYYLEDPNNPSQIYQPAILWDDMDKDYSIVIDVFDPFDLQYNKDYAEQQTTCKLQARYKELVTSIIKLWKPAHIKTYIRFYNAEGVIDEEQHWYYTYDFYARSLYTHNPNSVI